MSKIFDSVIIYGSGTTNSSTLETLNGNKINTFTIKDNGNVGIGTSTPSSKLVIDLGGTSGSDVAIQTKGSIPGVTGNRTTFSVNNNGRLTAGDVGVGTPSSTLGHILAAPHGSTNAFNVQSGGLSQGLFFINTDGSFSLGNPVIGGGYFESNGTNTFRFYGANSGQSQKIGINGGVPTATLHIQGSGSTNYSLKVDNSVSSPLLYVKNDGNVGIGTATPDSKLVIKGSDSSSSNFGLKVQDSGGTNNLVVKNNGNVGINISNPSYQLEVLPKDLTGTTSVAIRNTSTSPNWSNVSFSVTNGSNHGIGMMAYGNGVDTVLNINSGAYSYLSHSVNGISVAELLTGGVGQLLWRLPDTFQFRRRVTNGGWVNFNSLNQTVSIYNENIGGVTIPARLGLRGDTNTSSSYSLVIQNSGGTNTLVVRDDGNVGIGTSTPDNSAILQVDSTTKGFLPPRMTGSQAEGISNPSEGLMVYITNGNGTTITSKGWWGTTGTTSADWVKIGP